MYILTEEFNDYDQHGDYFVAAFKELPTIEIIKKFFKDRGDGEVSDDFCEHLIKGGGRLKHEYVWYNLDYYEPL